MESCVHREEPPPASAPWLLVSRLRSASPRTALTTSRGHSGAGRRRAKKCLFSDDKQGVPDAFHHLEVWSRQEVLLIDRGGGARGQAAAFVFIYPSG